MVSSLSGHLDNAHIVCGQPGLVGSQRGHRLIYAQGSPRGCGAPSHAGDVSPSPAFSGHTCGGGSKGVIDSRAPRAPVEVGGPCASRDRGCGASSLLVVGSTSPRPGSVTGCGLRVQVRTPGVLGLCTHMPAHPGTCGSHPGGLTKVPAGPRSPLGWQWEFWRVSVPGTRVFLDVPTGTHMAGALGGSHCPITGDSAAWRPCGTKGCHQSLEKPKHPNVPRAYGPPSSFTEKTPF